MAQQRPSLSTAALTAAADAIGTLLDSGTVLLYHGARPLSPDIDPATMSVAPVLLATLTLPSPAFNAAANGMATAHTISPVTPDHDGHPDWFRAFKSDGTTPVIDGSCAGNGSGDIWLTHELIDSNSATIGVTAWYLRPTTLTG